MTVEYNEQGESSHLSVLNDWCHNQGYQSYARREKYKAIFLTGENESIHIDFYGVTTSYTTAKYNPERGEIMCKDGEDKST